MKELITLLQEIENDFYKGVYTVGERYELIRSISEILNKQKFI